MTYMVNEKTIGDNIVMKIIDIQIVIDFFRNDKIKLKNSEENVEMIKMTAFDQDSDQFHDLSCDEMEENNLKIIKKKLLS